MIKRIAILFLTISHGMNAIAQASPEELAKAVHERPSHAAFSASMKFTLTNARGKNRVRVARILEKNELETEKTAIHFLRPGSLKGAAFLTHDNVGRPDESWLYLPAVERTRTIPASDDGDYFLGTDLTYYDLRSDFKFAPSEWHLSDGSLTSETSPHLIALDGSAISDELVTSTGYSVFRALIDSDTLFPLYVEYNDKYGSLLKTITVLEVEKVAGIWTALRFKIENLQSGHTTLVEFSELEPLQTIPEKYLLPRSLEDGNPGTLR